MRTSVYLANDISLLLANRVLISTVQQAGGRNTHAPGMALIGIVVLIIVLLGAIWLCYTILRVLHAVIGKHEKEK